MLYIPYGDQDNVRDLKPDATTMPLWGLDATLVRFRRLKKLTMCFPELPDGVTLEGVKAAVATCFPRAHAMGVLDVSVRAWALEW